MGTIFLFIFLYNMLNIFMSLLSYLAYVYAYDYVASETSLKSL